jgi:anti-anti-sigma factor
MVPKPGQSHVRSTSGRNLQPAEFQIEQSTDASGVVLLQVLGELDLAVAPALIARLGALKEAGAAVRLDLSRLQFMDSTGLGTVLTAVLDARRDGWELEIDPVLARSVQRIIDVSGVSSYLWPERTAERPLA